MKEQLATALLAQSDRAVWASVDASASTFDMFAQEPFLPAKYAVNLQSNHGFVVDSKLYGLAKVIWFLGSRPLYSIKAWPEALLGLTRLGDASTDAGGFTMVLLCGNGKQKLDVLAVLRKHYQSVNHGVEILDDYIDKKTGHNAMVIKITPQATSIAVEQSSGRRIAIVGTKKIFFNIKSSGIRTIATVLYCSLGRIAAEGGIEGGIEAVDFVEVSKNGRYLCNTNVLQFQDDVILNNFHTKTIKVRATGLLLRPIASLFHRKKIQTIPCKRFATDLSVYTDIFTLAPWVNVELEGGLTRYVGKLYTVFHDNLPLMYRLTGRIGRRFSLIFHAGMSIGLQYGKFFCVSSDAARQLTTCYNSAPNFDPAKIFVAPQVLPQAFYEPPAIDLKDNGAIILGNIADKRKRFDYAIEVLKRVKNARRVYIYGGRCKAKIIWKFYWIFYVKLGQKFAPKFQIHWFDAISTKELVQLFDSSAVLLFPSENEGIGLPIIEAQLRGVRACVQDKPPMRDLLVDGGLLLSMNPEVDAARIDEMLADTAFDRAALASKTRKNFDAVAFDVAVKDILINKLY